MMKKTNEQTTYLTWGLIGEKWPFQRDAARAVKACLQGYSSEVLASSPASVTSM